MKKYLLETQEATYLRIWQRVNFGKEILEPKFFEDKDIPGSLAYSFKLSVYQYDTDTRFFKRHKTVYSVKSNEPIYNYLDTGRVISLDDRRNYYTSHDNSGFYIFNNLNITDEEVLNFEAYKDRDLLNIKLLSETIDGKIYLIYDEDLAKIKKEEEKIGNSEKETEIKNEQEEERLKSLIRQYDKMTLLEDTDTIIKDNYFIDKKHGFKVEFKDKVVKIFNKKDLINDNVYQGTFIEIDYGNFLYKLSQIYYLGKLENPLEAKLYTIDKKILDFKIYSYDKETKAEVFLKEIKVENLYNDKDKLRIKVNGIKMPKQKMNMLFNFIGGNRRSYYHGGIENTTVIERLTNLEKYLEQIRYYSGTQLELLSGRTVEIKLNENIIPIHFNIKAEDKDHWTIGIDDFSIKRNYHDVRNSFNYLRGGGLSEISNICVNLNAGKKLEDILISKVIGYVEKRRIAEERAEKLFTEFLEQNKTRIFQKNGGYIVKGKLKNYLVKMKDNDNDVGVWSYPANEYVCINEKTKAGQYLCKYDKLLQFCLCMLNDGNLREEIYTIH